LSDGREKQIEKAISNSHIQTQKKYDGGEEKHLQWADDSIQKDLSWGMLLAIHVVAASKLWAAEFSLKKLDFPAHQNSGVGLPIEKLDPNGHTRTCNQ
jgi:hypothetical protein